MNQVLMNEMKKQLTMHEGKKHTAYTCPGGKLTIGVGRNLEDRGLSDDEIDYLLSNDIKSTYAELSRRFKGFSELDDVRQRVLVDMGFNLGMAGLFKFKRMFAALDIKDYDKAAVEMLDSRWACQVGHRAHRLADMMRR
ncbi:hypothetical protein PSECIP111951_01711 [Pseudoalteromonas holothuriae]|uniref:Lysozyme n=1 Tax=Pseudoalteromonas holothuriae TaxID=2963714 RepID=A0ABM9GHT0_9GAMM|nr:glycoside hydrolase family protein [Pseudoalteromonas sp. CIP111951]CAH9057651.1 hypothetical protein PSECIP111951_01711 [Pseudoalteromonas sp. CIP111951]